MIFSGQTRAETVRVYSNGSFSPLMSFAYLYSNSSWTQVYAAIPSDAPDNVSMVTGAVPELTWTNPVSYWSAEIEWYNNGVSDYTSEAVPGAVSQFGVDYVSTNTAQARIRYFSGGGVGSWVTSNVITVP